ncbi:MAG: hypothetical protein LUG83_01525 [Lachnospiraceae bacterium]|nr:hypothetical protein [Lachnospiraceae bacterium]
MDGQNFNNGDQNPYGQNPADNSAVNNYYQDNNDSQSAYQNYTGNSETIPPYQNTYQDNQFQENNNGLAVAGLVMGIISILFSCCYGAGIIFGVAGWICSAMANKKNPTGLGKGGLITSIVGTVLSILIILCFIVLVFIGTAAGIMYY